jgi:hypothetical protein
MAGMDWPKAIGLALVIGLIGPLFWLGVNVLESRLKQWLRGRKTQKTTAAERRLR